MWIILLTDWPTIVLKIKTTKLIQYVLIKKSNNLALSPEKYDLADKVLIENSESSHLVREK